RRSGSFLTMPRRTVVWVRCWRARAKPRKRATNSPQLCASNPTTPRRSSTCARSLRPKLAATRSSKRALMQPATPLIPTQTESRRSKRTAGQLLGDLLCVALLLLLCLSFGLARYRSGIDLADEGCLAYGAVRVMDGQMPNRDFVSLQPPLS